MPLILVIPVSSGVARGYIVRTPSGKTNPNNNKNTERH